jgi:hypothetical protein
MYNHNGLLACAIFASMAVATNLGADGSEPPPASLGRSLVVSGQGYFPVAIRLQDGRIAVVLRGGAPHVGIQGRLDMVFSSDEGRTWTNPALVIDSPLDDRNPALGQAPDGAIVVGYLRNANYDDNGRYDPKLEKPISTWVTRSEDGGQTWSESAQIDTADIGWASPYGKILVLPDGAMLMPIYGGPIRVSGEKGTDTDNSYIYRSGDSGKTWQRYATPGPQRFNETALVRLSSGRLLAAMRSRNKGDVSLTESSDDGKTWSEPRQLTPAKVHPADLMLLSDERILLVTGYRVGPFGVRGIMGDKHGEFEYGNRFILVNDATSTDCGYPSSVLLKDGRILTVYYAVGSKDNPQWGVHCGAVTFEVPVRP